MLKKSIALGVIAICLLFTGCTSLGRNNNLQVKVSGPAGTKFTCKYQFGELAGSVSTATTGRDFETILDITLHDGYCEFSKTSPAVLEATIFEAGRERFSFRSSTNATAFRLIRESGNWRNEVVH